MVHFGEFLKTWSLRSNSVTRQVNSNRTKIGGKCQNATFWVIFKQSEVECGGLWIYSLQSTTGVKKDDSVKWTSTLPRFLIHSGQKKSPKTLKKFRIHLLIQLLYLTIDSKSDTIFELPDTNWNNRISILTQFDNLEKIGLEKISLQ